MAHPLVAVAAFGEAVEEPEALGERAERLVVGAHLGWRLDRPVHRRDPGVGPAGGHVVALERGGRGEDDVGEARDRVPPRLVHDHGLGALPGARQAVQVLVVMERISAAPVDEAHVRERDAPAVVVDLTPRLEQHVGDTGDRHPAS